MATPLINGTAYGWSSIEINILGVAVVGVSAISYEETQEMENIYGAGSYPVARGYGNITTTGSITLHMSEVEALQAAAPNGNGRIQEIPEFDITISYLPADTASLRTHVLKNVRFSKNARAVNQNDKNIAVEIPLQISHIQWNN